MKLQFILTTSENESGNSPTCKTMTNMNLMGNRKEAVLQLKIKWNCEYFVIITIKVKVFGEFHDQNQHI